MKVSAQNVWPALDKDVMSLTGLADRFMPVGFYYKTFMRPRQLWPFYERTLRKAAGLGVVDQDTPWGTFDKQYLHGEVAVVGGGPSGMRAALSAARAGARVLLFDTDPRLGGHLQWRPESDSVLAELPQEVESNSHIEIFTNTTILGWYQDNWLAAVRGNRLFKIRAGAIVVATGTIEVPPLFDNNDLPGVMLGSAVQRLLNLYGVSPGKRVVVVTANHDGWNLAADLHAYGIELAGVVDERATSNHAAASDLAVAGVPIFNQSVIRSARGKSAVSAAVISGIDDRGDVVSGSDHVLACDVIAVSTGWSPALDLLYTAGGKSVYNDARAEMSADPIPPGLFLTGSANGADALDVRMDDGQLAGQRAAAFLELTDPPSDADVSDLERRKSVADRRTSDRISAQSGKKRFVCFCEDVTDVDVSTAIAEGYDSVELLKRYSTISMGPCQGKMCSLNALRLCSLIKDQTIQETGRTTSRPPTTPVSFGALAGQNMEPVQVSSVHDWHLEHGARMMVAGPWLRPEHYGNATSEVEGVRNRVGLIDVSPLGKFQLTGTGVPYLLERLYINQWRELRKGRVRYGVMCNDEAVVIDDGVCAHLDENTWYLSTTSTGAGSAFQWIQWWLQSGWGDGIHLTDMTETYSAFNLAGPRSRDVLQKLTERDVSNKAIPYMRIRRARVADVPCRLLRIGFTGELSYEIHCPSASGLHVWDSLMEAGEEFGIAPFGVEAQRILRLEKGHLIVGQDTDAMSDPLSADLAWAVKLDKPDFLGKRSLERISAQGPKQRLVGFEMVAKDVVPEEGLQIVRPGEGGSLDIIGWVSSSRFSPTLQKPIGLCWLPSEIGAGNGAPFTIHRDGRLEEALVHHGPFFDPEGERLKS
jgi:sarcosine oxidase subunit alpha